MKSVHALVAVCVSWIMNLADASKFHRPLAQLTSSASIFRSISWQPSRGKKNYC
jgi:hypothetical protein